MKFETIAAAAIARERGGRDRAFAQRVQFWRDHFGDAEAEEIRPADVRDGMNVLVQRKRMNVRRTGKGIAKIEAEGTLSPASVNRYVAALGTVYRLARESGALSINAPSPTRGVPRMKATGARVVQITLDDARALIACARLTRNPSLAAMISVATTTGLRLGSISALRWRDVLLDGEAPHIDVARTKNGDPHRAALLPFVAEELRSWRRLSPKRGRDDLVFVRRNPNKALKSALRLARLPEEWTFHHLRHIAASLLAQSGASVLEITQTLGQRSTSMAMRYAHLNTTSQRAALAKAWGAA